MSTSAARPLRPVVLVHGAWHGAWCFAALQAELDRRGIPSWAVDLPGHGASTFPLGDLYGDAAHVSGVLGRLATHGHDDVVLVGHSYGGAVITEAATHADHVAHLVHLTAFALVEGESVLGLLGSLPPAPVALGAAIEPRDDGTSVLRRDLAAAALYGHCPPEAVAAALPRLGPQPMASFTQPVTGTPTDRIPSTYVRCTDDQAIHVSHQDHLAERCRRVVTLDTDHSPFLSMTGSVADLLEDICRVGP
jgi:pimeloyl-ACP methyl ester carboxylesterase